MKSTVVNFLIQVGMLICLVLLNFISWKWVIPFLINHGSSLGLELAITMAVVGTILSGYALIVIFPKKKRK